MAPVVRSYREPCHGQTRQPSAPTVPLDRSASWWRQRELTACACPPLRATVQGPARPTPFSGTDSLGMTCSAMRCPGGWGWSPPTYPAQGRGHWPRAGRRRPVPPAAGGVHRRPRRGRVKASGDKAAKAALKALRRPTVSAWLVDLLAVQEPDLLGSLLALGPELARAQAAGQGDELRRLGAQRRELVEAVVDRAVQLGDRTVTAAVREEVAGTLEAALADPASADAVRSGRLVRPLSYAGFGGVDLDGAVAPAVSAGPDGGDAGATGRGKGKGGRRARPQTATPAAGPTASPLARPTASLPAGPPTSPTAGPRPPPPAGPSSCHRRDRCPRRRRPPRRRGPRRRARTGRCRRRRHAGRRGDRRTRCRRRGARGARHALDDVTARHREAAKAAEQAVAKARRAQAAEEKAAAPMLDRLRRGCRSGSR